MVSNINEFETEVASRRRKGAAHGEGHKAPVASGGARTRDHTIASDDRSIERIISDYRLSDASLDRLGSRSSACSRSNV